MTEPKLKSNKYKTLYSKIIDNANLREANEGYTENHHIVPKSFGGSDDKSNIVTLTAREHFLCHYLLTKFTDGKFKAKMIYAFHMMATTHTKNRYVNSRLYESNKKAISIIISKKHKGKSLSKEHKRKIGEGNRGKIRSDEWRRKKSESVQGDKHWFVGKHHTDETKKRISESRMGAKHPFYGKKLTDQHRQKLSIAKRGVMKAVIQLTTDLKYVNEYESIEEAARQVNTSPQNIRGCLNTKKNHRTAKGFVWGYKTDFTEFGLEKLKAV